MKSENTFEHTFRQALLAGKKRDYARAVRLLESLAAAGEAAGEKHPQILLYLGRSWHAEKNYARAVQYFKTYLRLCPQDGAGWFFLGRSYLTGGLYPQAANCLKKSIKLKEDSVAALTLLGTAYLKAKHSAAALAVFEAALNIDPDNRQLNQGYRNALFIEAVRTFKRGDSGLAAQMFEFLLNNGMDAVLLRVYMGHALKDTGDMEGALFQYQMAAELSPGDTMLGWYCISTLFALGRNAEARNMIKALRGSPSGPAGLFQYEQESERWTEQLADIKIIQDKILTEKWHSALQAGVLCLKKHGSLPVVHIMMGEAFRNTGSFDSAEQAFRTAVSLEPSNPAPRYGLLMTLLDRRDWKRLRAELSRKNTAAVDEQTLLYCKTICDAQEGKPPQTVLQEAQRIFPSFSTDTCLMMVLASQYIKLGLSDLALGWYQRVCAAGKNEEAFLGVIACFEDMRQKENLDKAYRAYLEKWPNNMIIRKEYTAFLEHEEKWAEAADSAEKSIPYEGQHDALERQIAFYRRKAKQYGAAAILYRGILQRRPEDRHSLHCLVFCMDRLGAPDKALVLIQKATAVIPPSAEGMLIEANLLLRTHSPEKAAELLKKGMKKFPADARFGEKLARMHSS